MSTRQTGVLHHADGTTTPIVFEPIPGGFNDHRAMTLDGLPLKMHQGDRVTVPQRMAGQSFLLADKVSGRRPYVSAQSAREAQAVAKRLPAPRVRLEPAVTA